MLQQPTTGAIGCPGPCYGCHALPTLPLGDLAVAMRGERRALPWGEFLGVVLRLAARRRRLFPSFLGVLRMLNASDCRRSAWGGGETRELREAQGGSSTPLCSSPALTCLLGAGCSLRRLTWELRRSPRSRGVWGRGKQLVGFLVWKRGDKQGWSWGGQEHWWGSLSSWELAARRGRQKVHNFAIPRVPAAPSTSGEHL